MHILKTGFTLSSCSVVQLERMCIWWERFSCETEALSLWISEKEKELEAVNSTFSSDLLDKHIITVEVSHYFKLRFYLVLIHTM